MNMNKKSTLFSLIGNPNCGKTTLFNALTGSKQRVGNWPGVTVDKKTGYFFLKEKRVDIIDLPGTYSIEQSEEFDTSQDEAIVHHFLQNDRDSILVNIVDASNLQRNLYLTFQLLELNRPLIVILNMMDVAKQEGYEINLPALQRSLGCPVIPVSANKGTGIPALKELLASYSRLESCSTVTATLSVAAERTLQNLFQSLPNESVLHNYTRASLFELLHTLPKETAFNANELECLRVCHERLAAPFGGEIDIALASARYEAIDSRVKDVVKRNGFISSQLTQKIDKWALGRFTGIPIFLLVMLCMFILAINVGSAFIDFFEALSGAIFVDGFSILLERLHAPEWLIALLAFGIGSGIQTVSTFIPVIAAMFFCLSFLEDSGYLARAAMVVDRGMQSIGLPGKAFVPMIVGFGCNIPAIMGTRTLESARDRLMSIMMIPFMSCGARLPVYALFSAIFFPKNGGMIVYLLYLLGIVIAILTGFVLKHTLLQGSKTPFIMELPLFHLPTWRGLLLSTWDRLKAFIYKAGKAIVIVVACLGLLNTWGTDGSMGKENSSESVLSSIGRTLTPLFKPMGINEDNWPATVSIFTGIFAKETVIGTLNALYTQLEKDANPNENDTDDERDDSFSLWEKTKEALWTIPNNLKTIPGSLLDPLGINETLAEGSLETVQEDNEVNSSAVKQIQQRFTSQTSVIAYLIFVLLYTPCVAALGAIYRETGFKWTLLVSLWTLLIGWSMATGYYQISLLGSEHTSSALLWLGGLTLFLVILFFILRLLGNHNILASSKATVSQSHINPNDHKGCC